MSNSLNLSSIDKLPYGESLKNHDNLHSIIQTLVEKIKLIPQVDGLHLNIDLIIWVCQAIDHILVDSKLKNVDKYQLFKSIYMVIFPETTEKEQKTIEAIVHYLHSIKIIAKINKTPWYVICSKLKSFAKLVLNVLSITS